MFDPKSNLIRAFFFILLMSLVSVAQAQEETWRLNLKDAEIRAFVTQVADITGYSFVVDPRVKGKVTVLSSAPMNKDEIYDLFLAVLNVHGFTAIPGEEVIKIIQQVDAKQSAESLERFETTPSEQLITRVIQVENANALEMVPILRPLVVKYGHLAGVAAANALIISDHRSNIERIAQIVSELDAPPEYEVEVIQLKEAWVGDMVTLLQELAPEQLGAAGGGSGAGTKYSVTADERSNRLILRGDQLFREKMRALITQLDQPSATGGTTKVIRLKHADAKNLTEILKGVMGELLKEGGSDGSGNNPGNNFAVFADEGLNALVVRGDPSLMQEAEQIVAQLDVRRAQVMIEAAIVEISDELGDQLGVQVAGGDESSGSVPVLGTNLATGEGMLGLNSVIGALVGDTLPQLGGGLTVGAGERNDNGITWGVLVQALSSSAAANLLSTPSIITLDNQESEIIVGQNVPFRTGESTVTGDGLTNPFTTIERRDVGLSLKVTPTISDDGLVRLVVEQTTEDISTTNVSGASDLITNKREIKTTVLADDGETVVLGGLIKDDYQVNKNKVPLLGDIPVLGRLFSSESESRVKRNLLVFLRPTIMLGKEDASAATAEKFNRLWDVNLEVREKLDLPGPSEQPSVDMLFEGRRD
ncbi:MAG: type II secretion system secretin GspD [Alteromonadaceae bacterium]|nr:type II secretion system secretin GspD [Alteromonadaceae bacterium]